MAKYLMIASRDPFECNDVAYYYEMAQDLVRAGNQVTLFLVQNGVLPARSGARAATLATTIQNGVNVYVDAFSMRERAMEATDLMTGVSAAPLDMIINHMADGGKTIWH